MPTFSWSIGESTSSGQTWVGSLSLLIGCLPREAGAEETGIFTTCSAMWVRLASLPSMLLVLERGAPSGEGYITDAVDLQQILPTPWNRSLAAHRRQPSTDGASGPRAQTGASSAGAQAGLEIPSFPNKRPVPLRALAVLQLLGCPDWRRAKSSSFSLGWTKAWCLQFNLRWKRTGRRLCLLLWVKGGHSDTVWWFWCLKTTCLSL